MNKIIQLIREALGPSTHIGRIGGGYVPLPVPKPDGRNLFIINCEYPDDIEHEPADRILETARSDAVTILRALSPLRLDDTTGICVRFGFYVGVKLRETVYACNLPASYLAELSSTDDARYWLRKFDLSCPIEYSTIHRINELL
jgi:hypothetical protein